MADVPLCSGCKFWRSPSIKPVKETPADWGDCRLQPPQPVSVMSGTCIPNKDFAYPILHKADWCGQWVKKS